MCSLFVPPLPWKQSVKIRWTITSCHLHHDNSVKSSWIPLTHPLFWWRTLKSAGTNDTRMRVYFLSTFRTKTKLNTRRRPTACCRLVCCHKCDRRACCLWAMALEEADMRRVVLTLCGWLYTDYRLWGFSTKETADKRLVALTNRYVDFCLFKI